MKIDILMATYNGEKYLKAQIDSILNQSFSDFRLLISDDVSTDKTREILDEYVKKDKRIVVFLQKKNLGVVQNFEFLMKKVENEYFMFSDQDDIWQKDKIKNSIDKMQETDADLVYTDLQVVSGNLNSLNVLSNSFWKLKKFDKKVKKYNNFVSLYLNNYITGCTMLVKSEWLDKILPLPKKSEFILHDYWTALVVSQFGKMIYIEEPQVRYRQHADNNVGSKRKSDEINNFDTMRELFIEVKRDHFKTFMQNEDIFDDEIKKLNKISYQYFQKLKFAKKLDSDDYKLFWRLYKYEDLIYKWQNFLILNKPKIAKHLFKFIKGVKKQ